MTEPAVRLAVTSPGEHRRGLLSRYSPRFKDKHFWMVQAIVVTIAIAHASLESQEYLTHLGALYFLPASIYFIPVVYAAINFGLPGSIGTAVWVAIITIPNLIFWHVGLERIGEIFQMSLLIAVAIFVGQRVERETGARQQAEAAGAALRAYAKYIVRAQEDERRRIARELHDEIIQGLALICRRLSSLHHSNQPLPPGLTEELSQTHRMAEQSVKALRDFARALRPAILDDLGIVPSLRRLLLDSTERTGMKGELKLVGEEKRLPSDIEVGVFRIAQEAIRNVEHHSKATQLNIIVTLDKDEARLEISDNGVGFNLPQDLGNFSSAGRLGLLGMQERARLFGGEFHVFSEPERGTRVTISVPLQNKI